MGRVEMIVLDTHIWVWWVHGDSQLPEQYQQYIQGQESQGLGISAISCWEIAKEVSGKEFTQVLRSMSSS